MQIPCIYANKSRLFIFFLFLARYYAILNTIDPLPAIQQIRYVHNSSVTEDTLLKMLKTQVKPL